MELTPSQAAAKARIDAYDAACRAQVDAATATHRAYIDALEAQGLYGDELSR